LEARGTSLSSADAIPQPQCPLAQRCRQRPYVEQRPIHQFDKQAGPPRTKCTSDADPLARLEARIAELEAQNEQLKKHLRHSAGEAVRAETTLRAAVGENAKLKGLVETLQGRLRGRETGARITGWVAKARVMDWEAIAEMGDLTLEMGEDKPGDEDIPLGQSLSCMKPAAGGIMLAEFLRRKKVEEELRLGEEESDEELARVDELGSGEDSESEVEFKWDEGLEQVRPAPVTTALHGASARSDTDTDDQPVSSPTPAVAKRTRKVLQPIHILNASDAKGAGRVDDIADKVAIPTKQAEETSKLSRRSCMKEAVSTPSRSPRPVKPTKIAKKVRIEYAYDTPLTSRLHLRTPHASDCMSEDRKRVNGSTNLITQIRRTSNRSPFPVPNS